MKRPDNRLSFLSLFAHGVEYVLKSLLPLLIFSINPTKLPDRERNAADSAPNNKHIGFQGYTFKTI